MPRLVIDFEGLVCHVGTPKTHAVLVHEPSDHTAEIEAGALTLTLNQWDTVSFEGPPAGAVRTDPTFDRRVLQLSNEIRNGVIIPAILQQQHAQGSVVAYVRYPAGILSAPRAHPDKLKITLGNATPIVQCVAMGVRFESDEFASTTFTIVIDHHDDQANLTHTDRFTFASDTKILINNVSRAGNHFYHYLRLTTANQISKVERSSSVCNETAEDPTAFVAKVTKEQDAFREPRVAADSVRATNLANALERMASVNPECTNSQWP
jgi:tRNA A37 threonylcarbamoyladenosine biosynthesis protein TsaE